MNNQKETNIDKIFSAHIERNEYIKNFLESSLKMKDALATADSDEDIDIKVEYFTDEKEQHLNKIKDVDLYIKHYVEKLTVNERDIYEQICSEYALGTETSQHIVGSLLSWGSRLSHILNEQRQMLTVIRETDHENVLNIKRQMEDVQLKLKNIKNNQKLTNRFNMNDDISNGTLFNEKT